MIRKMLIGAGFAALAATAVAAGHDPMGGKDMTRDDMVAKARDHFAKMDANKDGAVTTDEMKVVHEMRMAMRHGDKPHDMMIKRDPNEMFDRFDANKDGSISRDEFAKGHEMRIEKRIEIREKMKEAKGDHQMGGHHGHGGRGMHMLAMADADKDGKVTLAEAEAMAAKHFDQMDANRDGKVTAEERKAAHQGMKMKMREIHTEHAPNAS